MLDLSQPRSRVGTNPSLLWRDRIVELTSSLAASIRAETSCWFQLSSSSAPTREYRQPETTRDNQCLRSQHYRRFVKQVREQMKQWLPRACSRRPPCATKLYTVDFAPRCEVRACATIRQAIDSEH